MDSQAPNKAMEEWLWKKELFPDVVTVRPESVYGNPGLIFYVETLKDKILIEVKGERWSRKERVLFRMRLRSAL